MAAAAAAAPAGPDAAASPLESTEASRSRLKAELLALIDKRALMEEEMDVLLAALGSDGLKASLVDSEGFPRSDIDVVAVRGARSRYAVLQTDYSALMLQAERKLELLHALPLDPSASPPARRKAVPREPASAPAAAPAATSGPSHADRFGVSAFAEVLGVVQGTQPDGPAFKCGLRAGMEVLRFGSATAASARSAGGGLGALTAVTQASAGGRVEVVVRVPAATAGGQGAASATAHEAGSVASATSAAGGSSMLKLLVLAVPSPPRIGLHIVPPTPPAKEDA